MNNLEDQNFSVEYLKTLSQFKLTTFIDCVAHLGKEIETLTGIYYLVPIIQAAHESRNGNSGLARNHCNLFGITATSSWKKSGGAIALMPTFEYIKGKRIDMSREFRAYPNWRESFIDWSRIITTLTLYKEAYRLLKDKKTVVEGIKEMGKVYATDPQYASQLIAILSTLNIST